MESVSQKYKAMSEIFKDLSKQRAPPESQQKAKVKKDPNAPRKPLSGYMLFSVDMRDKVREKHPQISQQDVSRELGVLWKAISEKEKQVCSDYAFIWLHLIGSG
jgi:hypothetical protein